MTRDMRNMNLQEGGGGGGGSVIVSNMMVGGEGGERMRACRRRHGQVRVWMNSRSCLELASQDREEEYCRVPVVEGTEGGNLHQFWSLVKPFF